MPAALQTAQRTALKVAVIEHNDTLREVLLDSLSTRGLGEVSAFARLDAFEQQAAQHWPDVLVLDLDIPGTDGLALCSQLRAQHPELALMAMSATTRADRRAAALDAGADHVFLKPVLLAELVAGIRRTLTRRGAGKHVH